nr:peptidoglycan-binding protein [Pseudoclavibacter sp. Marseille-Q3772]
MSFAYVVEPSAQGSGQYGWNYKWAEPPQNIRFAIQAALKALGRYSGPVDGAWGPETIKGIQRTIQARAGYTGPIDGAVGKNTVIGVITYAYNWRYTASIHAYEPWSSLFTNTNVTWNDFRGRLVS